MSVGARLPLLPLRWAAFAVGALATAAAVSGASQHVLFTYATPLKYAVTVAAPLVLVVAAASREPLLVITPVLVVGAPFAGATASLGGVSLPLFALLLAVAAALAVVSGPLGGRVSALGLAAPVALVLLAVPVALGNPSRHYAVLFGTTAVTAWVVARAASLPRGTEVVLGSLIGSAALQGALAIWELRSGSRLDLYGSAGSDVFGAGYFFGYEGTFRPVGSFYDPISLGNVLALACPVALVLVARTRGLARLALILATALIGAGLATTLSRMSWIGAVAGCVLALALLPAGRRLAPFALAAAAVGAALVLATASGGGTFATRFDSIFHPTASSVPTAAGDRQRVELWRAALTTAEQHPLLGTGFGNLFPQLSHQVAGTWPGSNAQSTYLQVLAEGGLLGGAALVLVLAAFGGDLAAALRRDRLLGAGLAGAGLCLLLVWTTDWTFRYVPVAASVAVVLGLVAAQSSRRMP